MVDRHVPNRTVGDGCPAQLLIKQRPLASGFQEWYVHAGVYDDDPHPGACHSSSMEFIDQKQLFDILVCPHRS
jgi:hypothetical protein